MKNELEINGEKSNSLPFDPYEVEYGGINRTIYVLAILGITIIGIFFKGNPELQIVTIAGVIILAACRLKNIGATSWYSLLILIPFVNFIIGIYCLVCPEGYYFTKKLDLPGKIISGIIISVFVFFIVHLLFFLYFVLLC